MSAAQEPSPLRLRRKHGEGNPTEASAEDGARLMQAQSLHGAIVAGVMVFILFCVAWVTLASLTDRVFPWMTVVLGGAVGYAIRRAGRGVDWRFPVLAAVVTALGAVASNVVVAASTTAAEFGTDTLHVLRAVTTMTWPVFFDEHWNTGDTFFAALAAGVAAFLAPRKLTRQQYFAMRLWRGQSDRH